MIMKKWVSIDVGLGSMAMALLTGMAKQKSAIAMHKDKSNHGSKIHKNGTVFSLSLSQWRCWVWLLLLGCSIGRLFGCTHPPGKKKTGR